MDQYFENLDAHFADLLAAAETCLDSRQILPALVLMYSGVDIVASLERNANEGVKASFTRWVRQYLLGQMQASVEAIDLYAARCSILHTLSAESDLSRGGKARRVSYAWGTADVKDLERSIAELGRTEVAVHVGDLLAGRKAAWQDYRDEVAADPSRQSTIVGDHSDMWFSNLPKEVMSEFLEMRSRRGE